ncbi:conjugative transposon protein TraM, partial [bacterium]
PDTNIVSAGMETEQTDNKDMEALASPLSQMMPEVPGGNQPDPELKQLDGMLEKILDIEHPERVSEQLKAQSGKEAGRVFPVTSAVNTGNISLLERPFIPHLPDDSSLPIASDFQQNTFYDLSRPVTQESIAHQAITAVIDETQTLVPGATAKLRLTQDVYINGMLVPQNTFVFGTCEVSGERLKVQVKDIRYGDNIFPVSLSVYDMDGIEGIKVPGAITRNAAKQSSGQALEGMQLMSLKPTLGAQAAGAGIEAVKGLLSKKARLVRVTVKAGYPVLLVDAKAMQQ